jgi:tetratricopeptide (TPR) repeat protein
LAAPKNKSNMGATRPRQSQAADTSPQLHHRDPVGNVIEQRPRPRLHQSRQRLPRQGQHDDAIEDYDQAIKLDPNFARAYRNRGLARTKKGDKKGADADFAEARRTSISAQVQQPLPSIVREPSKTWGLATRA